MEIGVKVSTLPMESSALGQKQTPHRVMSVFSLKADIHKRGSHMSGLGPHQSSRRKQEGHPEPAAETMGTGVGRVHPIAHSANDADRLSLNLYNLGN